MEDLRATATVVIIGCFLFPKVASMDTEFHCRSNLDYDFRNIDRFTDNMCAQCLWYMAGSEAPWHRFHGHVDQWYILYNYTETINVLLCTAANNCTEFKTEHLEQNDHFVSKELKSQFYMDLLVDCCQQARECCRQMQRQGRHRVPGHCPPKWDGYMCWDSAPAGTTNYKACPSMTYFALGLKPTPCRNELANKECWPNSTWARIYVPRFDDQQRQLIHTWEEYTNYQPCSTPAATLKLKMNHASMAFYLISLVLTLVGFGMLAGFGMPKRPSLCEIHINFLLSLILTAVFSLCIAIFIKERHYRLNSMIDKNPYWCRVLMALTKFARLTNYCWMLNEGIILWQMVVRTFAINKIHRLKFYLIGWLLPVVVMAAYSVIHSRDPYNQSCWTKSMGYWELVYNLFPISFIIINFLLLAYILYVLIKKMNASQHLRSSVRRALVLVPVFGVHYIFYIVPFDPFESCATHLFVFEYVKIITEALQGAIVTTIFCFFNKEIRLTIKQRFAGNKFKHYNINNNLNNNERRMSRINSRQSENFISSRCEMPATGEPEEETETRMMMMKEFSNGTPPPLH